MKHAVVGEVIHSRVILFREREKESKEKREEGKGNKSKKEWGRKVKNGMETQKVQKKPKGATLNITSETPKSKQREAKERTNQHPQNKLTL